MAVNNNKIFGFSILAGILIWFFFFTILPVNIQETINVKTVTSIISGYAALCLGYMVCSFKHIPKSPKAIVNINKTLNWLIVLVIVSYTLRYVDLFFIGDLSFSREISDNRYLNEQNFKINQIIFVVASVLKSLYFFPAVIVFSEPAKRFNICYKIIASVLLVLPFFEGVLKATRKPFLEVFLIVVTTIVIYKLFTITRRKIAVFSIVAIALVVLSNVMLFNRESQKVKGVDIYQLLLDADYNEYMQPKGEVRTFLLSPNTHPYKKIVVFSVLHIGQYITHGFFEFNHLVNSNLKGQLNGAYTFSTIPKLFNVELEKRPAVYLTFFGAFYLDFRWFSLILMFLFGVMQRYIFVKALHSLFWRPLVVYVVIINVLLTIFCYVRGAGIYPFVGFLILVILFKLYEKSINT